MSTGGCAAVWCLLDSTVVDRYFNRDGLQTLRAGLAVKDHLGGRRKKYDGQRENGHAN